MATAEPVIACVGDSALWCTGTRYEDKTPNLVHKMLTGSGTYAPDGDPIPPAQFRARGGAIIGVSYPYRVTRLGDWQDELATKKAECRTDIADGGFHADHCKKKVGPKLKPKLRTAIQLNRNAAYLDGQGDYYGFIKSGADDWYDYYTLTDAGDVNQLKWTIARDIGWHWPRIVDQIEQFPRAGTDKPALDVPWNGQRAVDQFEGPADPEPPYAEEVDVLLINGGTNDIELGWLNNPIKARRSGILDAVKQHCYHDQKELLAKARDRFPNAVIFLVGYYPFASHWTSRKKAREFLTAQAGGAGSIAAIVKGAVNNALNFARVQSYWMRRAVAEMARTDDGPGTVFVSRGFGVVNAFDAPEAWSWGVPANETDDTGELREQACPTKHDGANVSCSQASIGHPNTPGSEQTARAVVGSYDGFTDLDLRQPAARQTDDRPTSLRAACENYDLDPDEDGVRYCMSHREVVSLRVDITTGESLAGFKSAAGGGSAAIDPKNDVYLQIEPGRSGTGERFRLETEYDDFQKGSTDHFFIDPMMGRQITADVGPVPELTGMDADTWEYQEHLLDGHEPSHLTEEDHDWLPYHRGARWDSKSLRLGMIERLSLDVVDTNPWALEEVTVEINGFIERTRDVEPGDDGISGDVEIEIWDR